MLRSLRARLIIGALLWIVLGVSLAGVSISALFRAQVTALIDSELTGHLDELSSLVMDSPDHRLRLFRRLSDPRFSNPGAGFYWQIVTPAGIVLRSPTLIGHAPLPLPIITAAGTMRRQVSGEHTVLISYERIWRRDAAGPIVLQVAADSHFVEAVLARFNQTLALSLAALALALLVAAALQIGFGLAPMRRMGNALADIRSGRASRLPRAFPVEVQPMADNLNALLDSNAEMVRRARTQAGNLAHALKTPLAILADEARRMAGRGDAASAAVVRQQTTRMGRQIDFQLTRARAAATAGTPGAVALVGDVLAPVVSAMARLYAARDLVIEWQAEPALRAAIDPHDLSEILANLIDNACKWAVSTVSITAVLIDRATVRIDVADDGPGIAPEHHDRVFDIGSRLDESIAGSGLGLAIVRELATLYGGRVAMDVVAPSGLLVMLSLRVPA
jgi:signal transduction histidine kinase